LGVPRKDAKAAKVGKINKMVCKFIYLSIPNLARFAPWRESIPAFEYFRLPDNLREPRKFSTIVIERGTGETVGDSVNPKAAPRTKSGPADKNPK